MDLSRLGARIAAILWVALAAPAAAWTARGFADDDGLARAIIAGVAAVAVLGRRPHADLGPARAHPAALAWIGAGMLVAGLAPPTLDLARGTAAALAGYGLLGLHLPRARWRALGALVPLALLTMPVGPWVDAICGWPLRTAVAAAAAAILGGIPTATVIEVEGGLASVDLPCAGLRSLWVGAAALCAWAAARGRPLDRGLVAAGLAMAAAMLVANVGRVVAIVGIAHRLGWPLVAETVHQPLGLVGFAVSGLVAAAVLAGIPARERPDPDRPAAPWAPWGAALVLAAALLQPAVDPGPAGPPAPVPLPAGWVAQVGTEAERAFAREHGAAMTHGRDPASGASAVLVRSGSWLAHHVPVRCLQAGGWTVARERAAEVGGHWVRVADVTRAGRRATAIWWYQRGDRITDDAVVRIGEGLRGGPPWVLVSVLVNDPGDAAAVVETLTAAVRTADATGRGA